MPLQRVSGVLQGNLATITGIVLTLTDFPFLLGEIHSLCTQHCSLVGPWLPSQPSAMYVTVVLVTLLCVGVSFEGGGLCW